MDALYRAAMACSSGTIDIRTEKSSGRVRFSVTNPFVGSASFALVTKPEVEQLIEMLKAASS